MSIHSFNVRCLDVTTSTNDEVKRAAEAGEAEGYVVQALRQTAGRGRHGRSWDSPEGNLYLSVLLRPKCPPQEACFYSFAAAMAVYDAVSDVRGEGSLQFKWPNDVLIDNKKISGILLESAPVENDVVPWLVVGVGINVSYCPTWTMYPTTSLLAEGADVSVEHVKRALLQSMHHWFQTLEKDGFSPVRRAWLADARRGQITVKLPSGQIQGLFGGLDASGGLILRLDDGSEKVIQAGDVFFI